MQDTKLGRKQLVEPRLDFSFHFDFLQTIRALELVKASRQSGVFAQIYPGVGIPDPLVKLGISSRRIKACLTFFVAHTNRAIHCATGNFRQIEVKAGPPRIRRSVDPVAGNRLEYETAVS